MGQTRRAYPVYEVALSCEDCAPHSGGLSERKLAGDIIALRRPHTSIGRKERATYLWLYLDGLEENDMAVLCDELMEGTTRYEKRRYCIPFDRLAAVVPGFSIARALDVNDDYQPFLPIDLDEPHVRLTRTPPLDVHGLVFDRATGVYL